MNDKQQLKAMGEHQAEQHMCMARQIEDLQTRLQECANGAAKMQEQRDYAYKMMGKFGSERDELTRQLEAANRQIAVMAELLRDSCDINKALGYLIDLSENDGKEDALSILSEHLDKCESLLSGELPDHIAGAGKMVQEGWQIVPIEPTHDMLHVMIHCDHFDIIQPEMAGKYYRKMLAAAPKPEGKK